MEPISSIDNLTKELEEDTEIASEYDENLRSSLINRLNTDGDFVPERFPKSQEYFKGNNKKWIIKKKMAVDVFVVNS